MRSLTIDLDGPLHYADLGGEGQPIVLVHGLGGSHANWSAVGPELARYGRVFAPDLAGFGLTPVAGRSAGVRANRALLDRFIDQVAGGPVVLAGNSMGGLLSLMEAALRPDRVAALVLVDPALPRANGTRPDALVAAAFAAYAVPGVGERFVRYRLKALGPEGLVRQTMQLCCVDVSRIPQEVYDAHVALVRRRIDEGLVADTAFLEAARSLLGVLAKRRVFHDMMRQVQAPTLIVHGDRDRLVPLAAAQAAVEVRPDWTLEVFEDTGHIPQLERPERFVEVVAGWLEGLGLVAGTERISS